MLSVLAGKKYWCKVLERDVHEVHGGKKRGVQSDGSVQKQKEMFVK